MCKALGFGLNPNTRRKIDHTIKWHEWHLPFCWELSCYPALSSPQGCSVKLVCQHPPVLLEDSIETAVVVTISFSRSLGCLTLVPPWCCSLGGLGWDLLEEVCPWSWVLRVWRWMPFCVCSVSCLQGKMLPLGLLLQPPCLPRHTPCHDGLDSCPFGTTATSTFPSASCLQDGVR